jgi:sulfonate transport system permease protein
MTATTLAGPPAAPTRAPAASRRPRSWTGFARRAASPIAIVVIWQLLSSAGVLDERTLASPLQIASTAKDLFSDGTLVDATLTSLRRVALGFLIGALIGTSIAVVAGLSRIGEDVLDPPMQMLRTLPHFGLIALFIGWFGIGEMPKIVLIAMGATFPLYLNTFGGIRNIDRKVLEAASAMGLTWRQRVRHVVLPGALPQALVGLRQSLGIAWLSLVVAETIPTKQGLGFLINDARQFTQTDVIVVVLVIYSILGLATDAIVRSIERRALAWRP